MREPIAASQSVVPTDIGIDRTINRRVSRMLFLDQTSVKHQGNKTFQTGRKI